MPTLEQLYDMMEKDQAKAEKEFGGGSGGGIVALCDIQIGVKVFAKGQSNADTWFPYTLGDEDGYEKAQTDAKKFAIEHGAFQMIQGRETNNPNAHLGISIIAHVEGAISGGGPAQWSQDRHFFVPYPKKWMRADQPNAFRDLLAPSLIEHGIQKFPWAGWCRLSAAPDPYKASLGEAGMTDTDLDGNPRFPLVFFVAEVYENEEAAKAGSVESKVGDNAGTPGPDWTWVDFGASIGLIKEAVESSGAKKVAEDYGLTLEATLFAAGAHAETGALPMIAKKFGVTPADITKAKALAEQVQL